MSELKKKPSILYIQQILQNYSHEKNPLTQSKIAQYLLEEYDIALERKAIGRCIDTLEAAGYDIVRDTKGVYLGTASALEDAQLQIIIDSVVSNRAISAADSKKLIDQLLSMGTAGLKARNPYINTLNTWGTPEKSTVRYNIDILQQAIQDRQQITFFYEESLFHLHHPTWGLYQDPSHRVKASPVQVVPREGYEYLVAIVQWQPKGVPEYVMESFRLDLMRDIVTVAEDRIPPEKVPGYEKGWNVKEFLSANPYMTPNGNRIRCKFKFLQLDTPLVKTLFGNDAFIHAADPTEKDTECRRMFVTVDITSGEAVRIGRRYNMELELVHPQHQREVIASQLEHSLFKYKAK